MHGTDVTGSGQILCKHNRASSPRANSTVIFSTCGSQNKKIESEHNEKDVRRKWVEGGMRAFRKNVVTAVFLRSTYRKPTLHAKQVYSIVIGADISLFLKKYACGIRLVVQEKCPDRSSLDSLSFKTKYLFCPAPLTHARGVFYATRGMYRLGCTYTSILQQLAEQHSRCSY